MVKPKRKKLFEHKVKHHEAEEGEGNWLVSYADMMTLLVGFFVILLSFSSIDKQKLEEAQKSVTKKFGGTYERPYGSTFDKLKSSLEKLGLGDAFVIHESAAGVEISFSGTVFFNSGSTEIKEEGIKILQNIIPTINEESKDLNILIEGHTDNIPVSQGSALRSNWEISSLRACRVLEHFENSGISRARLKAIGYADTKPLVPNKNEDGTDNKDNQASNRRVVIKIAKPESSSLGQ